MTAPVEVPQEIVKRIHALCLALPEVTVRIDESRSNLKVDGVVVGPEQVEDITKLPSREVLIGQVLSLILGPARQVLAMVNSPPSTLIGQLEAFIEKNQAPGESGEPAAEAPTA